MAPIETLPNEVIAYIAELTTRDEAKSRRSRLKNHSRFARTNRHFHIILNPLLYHINLTKDAPLDSCVLWAAQFGKLDTIKRAHSYGADLSMNGTRDDEDLVVGFDSIPGRLRFLASPLHFAIQNGDRAMLDYLMEQNVDLNVPSRSFCSCDGYYDGPRMYPLHTALDHSGIDDAAALLVDRGAYLLSKGSPAICHANSLGHTKIVEKLLWQPEPLAIAGALHYAIEKQDLGLTRELLERPGADATITNNDGQTCLHLALARPSPIEHGIVYLILGRPEVDASIVDNQGDSPLHICAGSPHLLEIAKFLLARPDTKASARNNNGITPLQRAAQAGNIPMFHLLAVQPEADLNVVDNDGRTVLHMVCGAPETEETLALVGSLIDQEVPLNRVSRKGTALYCAFAQHNFKTAQLLLTRGAAADLEGDGDHAKSLLHHCLEKPHPLQTELVKELLARGVEVDEQTNEELARDLGDETAFSSGGTPLFFAAAGAKNVECMKMLLEAGADVEATVVSKSCFYYDGLEMSDKQGFIAALFRHTCVDDRKAEMNDESVEELKERLTILLEHGATIGGEGYGISALAFAMKHANEGKPALLNFLVERATASNIHPDDVQEEIDDEDCEHSEEVLECVRRFKAKLVEEAGDDEDVEDEEEVDDGEDEEGIEEDAGEDLEDRDESLERNEDTDGDASMASR
ncbi:unnamed protein product [Clonostachys byssicola]|uniref:Uncharacterized protein n=1 Tax=Clonostachys byssicola TaxID=160290 RepID=A0A9N9U349_9HYPO|nr:unnamed protein product [Clonostachys byssicola]